MSQLIDHRDSVMSTLSAAEHLVALSPVTPASIAIPSYRLPFGEAGMDLHFSADVNAVEQFAATMGVTTSSSVGQFGDGWYTETVAEGDLNGVRFVAWTRTTLTAHEVQHLSSKQVAA